MNVVLQEKIKNIKDDFLKNISEFNICNGSCSDTISEQQCFSVAKMDMLYCVEMIKYIKKKQKKKW